MSDHSQILAFDTVSADDAPNVARSAEEWMVAKGFIAPELSDCVLGGLGHSPGANWRQIVDDTRTFPPLVSARRLGFLVQPANAPVLEYNIENFLQLWTKGVEVEVARRVCDSGENLSAVTEGVCPACVTWVDPSTDLFKHAEEWFYRRDSDVVCPRCGTQSKLEDWDFQPFWAFAEVSLEFWNWPSLSEAFVSDLIRAVGVPRLRHVLRHL